MNRVHWNQLVVALLAAAAWVIVLVVLAMGALFVLAIT